MYNWKYLKKQEIKVVLQDWHIIIVLVYVNVFLRDGAVYCTQDLKAYAAYSIEWHNVEAVIFGPPTLFIYFWVFKEQTTVVTGKEPL